MRFTSTTWRHCATVSSSSGIAGAYATKLLADGGRITQTQGSVSLESLLGRFIFSVTQMNANQGQGGGGGL